MAPLLTAILIVLAIIIAVAVLWLYSRRNACRTSADCTAPQQCIGGTCATLPPALPILPPPPLPKPVPITPVNPLPKPLPVVTGCTIANSRLALVEVNGTTPGPCVSTSVSSSVHGGGDWYTYANASPVGVTQIVGNPVWFATNATGSCQKYCDGMPECQAWMSVPDVGCYAFSSVPTQLRGLPTVTTGISAAAI